MSDMKYLTLSFIVFFLVSASCNAEINNKKYILSTELVDLCFTKQNIYKNIISSASSRAKLRYVSNPKTNLYSDILVDLVVEVLDKFLYEENVFIEFKKAYSEIYYDKFSIDELEDLVSFYRTKTGQKLLIESPEIARIGTIREKEIVDSLLKNEKYKAWTLKRVDELKKKGLLPNEF